MKLNVVLSSQWMIQPTDTDRRKELEGFNIARVSLRHAQHIRPGSTEAAAACGSAFGAEAHTLLCELPALLVQLQLLWQLLPGSAAELGSGSASWQLLAASCQLRRSLHAHHSCCLALSGTASWQLDCQVGS